jgi:acyl carrier protein
MNESNKQRLTEIIEDYLGVSIVDYEDNLSVYEMSDEDGSDIIDIIEEEFDIDMSDKEYETPNDYLQEIEIQLKD